MKNLKSILFVLLFVGSNLSGTVSAQRIAPQLGRGVVATARNNKTTITWRKLAQEPENAKYNVYTRSSEGGAWKLLNANPLGVSNYQLSTVLAGGTEIAVKLVVDGVEVGDYSKPFKYITPAYANEYMRIDFVNGGSPIDYRTVRTAFVWPVDLDGDGEYDYIVDRKRMVGGFTDNADADRDDVAEDETVGGEETAPNPSNIDKLEGYLADGTYLWTIEMGPNVYISSGQNDKVCVADIDLDGRAEVILKGSDGTRFWDSAANDWGKYLVTPAGGGGNTPDSDGDGILDYKTSTTRNAPQYIVVVDGLTGEQKDIIEMNYPSDKIDTYTRDNKKNYMGDEYSFLTGKMGVAYLDGIHPSIVMEYCNRNSEAAGANAGHHNFYTSAYSYFDHDGNRTAWHEMWQFSFNNEPGIDGESRFHHIRIGDVDADGRDEIMNGAICVNDDGTMLWSSGISHGDRFRMSDIDPERPGQEIFAIQQTAPSMLGQILYSARTGGAIKKWYMGSPGDVGRGECMDVLKEHKGYEMWSTMPNMYTAQGDVAISGTYKTANILYPTEGVWWDGELDREAVMSAGGKHPSINVNVTKYNGGRLADFSKENGYKIHAGGAVRAMFWGDIYGDWREELLLREDETTSGYTYNTGIVGFTTNYTTNVSNIYCLQQDPDYRGQCTTRGYYQAPNTSFYLGYDMPTPPLPPFMVAKNVWSKSGQVWKDGSADFTDMMRTAASTYKDGETVIFGLDGARTVTVEGAVSPDTTFIMAPRNPKGKDWQPYTFIGTGSIAAGEVWKSGEGYAIVNVPLTTTGTTYISDGTLELNTTVSGPLSLRARGTVAGNPTLNGDITFEEALNYEGCRLKPGTENAPYGIITFGKSLTTGKKVYVELDFNTDATQHDVVKVNGDLTLGGTLVFNIKRGGSVLLAGTYRLLEYTGTLTGEISQCIIKGMEGQACSIKAIDGALCLVVPQPRAAMQGVRWTGSHNGVWDYNTLNFSLDNTDTTFVSGDHVILDDKAATTNITLTDLLPIGGVTIDNSQKNYAIGGKDGGFSGNGGLTKRGTGTLRLTGNKSTYTGPTILEGGTVHVAEFAQTGEPSSIGAATADAANFQLKDMRLVSEHLSAATSRNVTITDSVRLQIDTDHLLTFHGKVTGMGTLVKEGEGQLTFVSSANDWTGGVVLNGGTICRGGASVTIGKGDNTTWIVHNGTFRDNYSTSSSGATNFNHTVYVPDADDSFTFLTNGRGNINGKWYGKGEIVFCPRYVRHNIMGDFSEFEGTMTVGNTEENTLRFGKGLEMRKGRLNVVGNDIGGYATSSGSQKKFNYYVGSLTGSKKIENGTWYVGYDNTDFTFGGIFADDVICHKYGTGKMTLSQTQNNLIYIREGLLYCTLPPSEKAVGINGAGATIQLVGCKVNQLNLSNGATLLLGATGNGRTTQVYGQGNILLQTGSRIVFHRNVIGCDRIYMTSGNVTLKSGTTLVIEDYDTATPLKSGDVLYLFTMSGGGTITNEGVTIQSNLEDGLYWDTSRLATEGVLVVAGTTGIEDVEMDSEQCGTVYDFAGVRVQNPEEGKMYIINGKKKIYKK